MACLSRRKSSSKGNIIAKSDSKVLKVVNGAVCWALAKRFFGRTECGKICDQRANLYYCLTTSSFILYTKSLTSRLHVVGVDKYFSSTWLTQKPHKSKLGNTGKTLYFTVSFVRV